MGLGSGGTPLYSPEDKIVLLNSTNFQVPLSLTLDTYIDKGNNFSQPYVVQNEHGWWNFTQAGELTFEPAVETLPSRRVEHAGGVGKENQHVGFTFAGVATAYTLHQHSSSLQPMSMVRFSLRQYPRFIAMQ